MKRVWLWLPVILWAALIFYFSSVPGLRITEAWYDIILRKLAHMGVFGILALLIRRALAGSTAWLPNRLATWSLLLTVLYAFSDEAHQLFVDERHGSLVDVCIDAVGAAVALGMKSCYRYLCISR